MGTAMPLLTAMPMATAMTADPAAALARLRLHQLVSPALPVGAFCYSEGLEVLVQQGTLADAAAEPARCQVLTVLGRQLHHSE